MRAMILAEFGDFSRFDSLDKVLAYVRLSPSTYQSGQLTSSYAHMEKRGSRSEGKHYNVAISHAAKKLDAAVESLVSLYECFKKPNGLPE